MSEKLSQLFKNIRELNPPAHLGEAVLAQIEAEKQRITRRKRMISVFGLAFSGATAVWAGLAFGNEILRSEFWTLTSLAFSDLNVVLANWQNFLYSLLETFPAAYAAVIITPIFVLLLSINLYSNNHNRNTHYNIAM